MYNGHFFLLEIASYFRNIIIQQKSEMLKLCFLNEVWFSSSVSLCSGASCCVNTGSGTQKLIFGSGTRLTIEPSEY